MEFFNPKIVELNQLATLISQQLETAEAAIPELNQALERLSRLEVVPNGLVIEGQVILEQAYSSDNGRHDSGQIIQAMLVTPKGIGAIYWDMEEYVARQKSPDTSQNAGDAIVKFVPFDECSRAVKALLLSQAKPLIDKLGRHIQLPPQ